jgi:hypothetical protein
MFSVDVTGRLVLIRIASPMDRTDVARLVEQTRATVHASCEMVVGMADLRQWSIMAPDLADMVAELLVRDNPKVERTALLVARVQSSLGLQFTRLLRASKSERRRLFDDPGRAAHYLFDLVSPPERRALGMFLAPAPSG